jgi:hypothetical protein
MDRRKGERHGQEAIDGMDAYDVLGVAFARGCAPEGAAPNGFDVAAGMAKPGQGCNAHFEAALKAITQRFPRASGERSRS